MQKKITHAIMVLCVTIFALSCNETDSKKSDEAPATLEDSVSMARSILKKYDSTRSVARMSRSAASDSVTELLPPEIAWDSVSKYRKLYEDEPDYRRGADVIKGFTISEETLKMICENARIISLYIAFGKKDNGDPVMMVLGLDADGKLIDNDESKANFDYTSTCPDRCP